MPWPSFLTQTRTATTIKIKSVPRRLRNVRTMVRNVVINTHCIVASMDKTMVTRQVIEKYSRQRMQTNKSLSMIRRITRRSSRDLIFCRHKMPIKNPGMKS